MLVTKDLLVDILRKIKGTTFIDVLLETKPQLKTPPAYLKNVVKLQEINACIGFHYANSVNRQRIREGSTPDFEALPRKWGQRILGTPLVEYKGKYYLELKTIKVLNHIYSDRKSQIPNHIVEAYLSPSSVARQKLDKPVILRDPAIDSIRRIVLNGVVYEVL